MADYEVSDAFCRIDITPLHAKLAHQHIVSETLQYNNGFHIALARIIVNMEYACYLVESNLERCL